MDIAILGAGNVGAHLGKAWAAAGHNIRFGLRHPADAKYQPLKSKNIQLFSVRDAAQSAPIVVLATPWNATQQAIADSGPLAGKTILDCTNPLKPDLSGLVLGTTTSGAEQVAQWAQGADVFKVFNTTGAANMTPTAIYPLRPVMFLAGDNAQKKTAVLQLAKDVGFDPIDCGPLTAARYLEPHAMLWIHLAVHQKQGPDFAFALMRRSR